MKLISSSEEDKRYEYEIEREGYSVKFTILNMGDYVGHKSRQWYEEAPDFWKTMFIDICSQEPKKNMEVEFLIDDKGDMLSVTLTDGNGVRRTRQYYNDSPNNTREREEALRGKGVSKVNGRWVQDIIYIPNVQDGDDDNIRLFYGQDSITYYYEEEKGCFVDENGEEIEAMPISDYELPEVLINAGQQVVDKVQSELGTVGKLVTNELGDEDIEL